MAEIRVPIPTWKQIKPWMWRGLILAVALYVAYLVREIWVPLLIAFLIALVLDPIVDRLERRGFTRAAGAALIFGSFIVSVAGLLVVGIPPLIDQGAAIQSRFEQVMPDHTPAGVDHVLAKQNASPMLRSVVKAIVANIEGSYTRSSAVFTDRLIQYASNLIWLVIVPIVAFYVLRDFHIILGKALLLVKRDKRDLVQSAVAEVTAIFARYMRGLLVVSVLNGLATWALLALLGVPSPFVLGVVAGALYSVPYLGALITVVLVCGVAFLTGGVNFMLVVLGANILLHQIIFDQIVTPRIVGGHVGLHPILAIVALLSGNALLGLLGMILAVPVAACIQIGVLAMIPKLKQEIELPDHAEVKHLAEVAKDDQIKVDATEEMHKTVSDAVDHIEQRIPDEEERRVRILARRKSRASESGQSA